MSGHQLSLILIAIACSTSAADHSPFSPPFLRGVQPHASPFSYLRPQLAPAAPLPPEISPSFSSSNQNGILNHQVNSVMHANAPPHMDLTSEPISAIYHQNQQLPGPSGHILVTGDSNKESFMSQPVNNNIYVQPIPYSHHALNGNHDNMLPVGDHDNMLPVGNHGNMLPVGNHGNMLPVGNHGNMLPVGNHDNMLSVGNTFNHQASNPLTGNNHLASNHQTHLPEGVSKTGRPQLRQLDLESPPPPSSAGVSPVRTRDVARRSRSNQNRVSEGHRLITRALWRIFDALMERNEKDALQERVQFVEGAIKDMITSDSKLEGLVEMVKASNEARINLRFIYDRINLRSIK